MTQASKELLASDLVKWSDVFERNRADFITVDGWVGQPAREQVFRAVKAGWLSEDPDTSRANSDDQYTAVCFRPTDKLRHALANKATPHG